MISAQQKGYFSIFRPLEQSESGDEIQNPMEIQSSMESSRKELSIELFFGAVASLVAEI